MLADDGVHLPRFKILEAVPAEVLQNPQLPRNKKAGSE
jgi:hypothetical protein